MTECDLLVIGSGPAGIAAATKATTFDLNVILIDEQPGAGGQIYRALENSNSTTQNVLGEDYLYGLGLIEQLQQSSVIRINEATVWAITNDGSVTYSVNQVAQQIQAKHIIIATGALERPYPVRGWTLPGVLTVGAAQILLKSSQLGIERAVLIGTGPLLYTVASQLINAGCKPAAVIDTVTLRNHIDAARYFPVASLPIIKKGLATLRTIKRAGVRFYKGATDIKINGSEKVQSVGFQSNGSTHTIDTDNALLHQGVVPNTQLSRSLRLDHQWNSAQHCFHPEIDRWGVTSMPNIRIAGDGSGIGGAIVAETQGQLVALGVLAALDLINIETRNSLAAPLLKQLNKHSRLRTFLDTLYAPPDEALLPADSTIVCRCEEVTAGDIRSYAKIGCSGPNQTKAFGRCGMGPCQGRYCGLTVTQILAAENSLAHNDVGAYRIRSPIKPVSLAELASLDTE